MIKKIFQTILIMPRYSDHYIHYTIVLLGLFGVVMQISAGMFTSSTFSYATLITLTIRQVVYFIAGYIAMVIVANLFTFKRFVKLMMILMVIVIVLLLLTRLSTATGGAYGWIRFSLFGFGFSIQPSEFAKLMMILVMAVYLGDRKNVKLSTLILPPFIFFMVIMTLIGFYQKDMGTAILLTLITFFCFMIPTAKDLRLSQLIALILAVIFFGLMIFFTTDKGIAILESLNISAYQLTRFRAVQNPFYDKFGKGYFDLNNSLIGFSRGSLFGVGLGKSILKYSYISAATTDFIMEVVVEELGFVGFMFVFGGYVILAWRLFKHSLLAKNERIKIVMIGVMRYFALHFIFNVGGVTCLIPLTGIPLLLISAGGSSTMASMMAIGVAQALINKEKVEALRKQYENNSR